jgi:hypothetical protein
MNRLLSGNGAGSSCLSSTDIISVILLQNLFSGAGVIMFPEKKRGIPLFSLNLEQASYAASFPQKRCYPLQ